jgi:hypothetical protein
MNSSERSASGSAHAYGAQWLTTEIAPEPPVNPE